MWGLTVKKINMQITIICHECGEPNSAITMATPSLDFMQPLSGVLPRFFLFDMILSHSLGIDCFVETISVSSNDVLLGK